MKTGRTKMWLTAMINRSSLFLLLLLVTLVSGTALKAQTPTLTLKDAINYSLNANQDARKARLDIENSNYKIDEVRSRALPQINGTASVTHNPLLQMSALPNIFGPNPNPDETILVSFGQKWNSNVGVSLSQALFDKSVLTGLKAARTTSEFYQLNSQLTEEQVIELVATNYYQVLVQRLQLRTLDSTIENTNKVIKVLRGQFENGLAKKIDLDRMEVNLSNLNSERQQLMNAQALLENQLKFYMGMPIQESINIPDLDVASIKPQMVPLESTVNVSNLTEVQLLKKQEQLLQYQKEAYKAEYYPSLSLSGNYSYQGMGNTMPVFKGQNQGVNWFDAASVGVNLRIPIFNGFATRSRVRQAEVSLKKLNEDIDNTTLALNLAHEKSKTQINNSVITLNAQQKNVNLAEEVFFNTQNNYNNGLASLTDLLASEKSLTEAQNSYLRALLTYRVAEIRLMKSQGQLKSLLN